jgi:hypothetical protein
MDTLDALLAIGATARLTRLVTEDSITERFRSWVVLKFGDDSAADTLVHCPWCASVWLGSLVVAGALVLPPDLFRGGALALTASHLAALSALHLENPK